MKKLLNKEFKLLIQNLLCAEEHTVDMLATANKKDSKEILELLKKIKLKRNTLLGFPEEKDRNKWCLIKHLLLAEYHSLELINQKNILIDEKEYRDIEKLLNEVINKNWDVNCNICVEDLLLFKFFKKGEK